ncbi:MAG: bifunctional diaminohydroxyphosphoribosylaminopyrimidine deaminase/5-amino-6-(5-phosphoribosylamino)uracil reductase RibD [Candidatus Eisenbacteria bacterium]
MDRHEWAKKLMCAALMEAEKGRGQTYPNPAVGAIIARGTRIVGRGFHRRWGLPHAEVEAIRSSGARAKGADLFVTLEPCCTHGKTPPCTDAIIESGIKRVVVATVDPNPAVRGKGLKILRKHGIDVEAGLEANAAVRLNEAYYKFMKDGRPFVTLKTAQTIDGKIAMRDGRSRWITSAPARRMGRRMRADAQAIVVGAGTVIKDNPGLFPVPRRKRNYYRCVLDSRLSISLECDLVTTARSLPTIVYCCRGSKSRRLRLEKAGVIVRRMGSTADGRVDLHEAVDDLASMGVMHAFVEGGSAVASSFMRSGLVDKLAVFVAPKLMGDKDGLGSFVNLDVKGLDTCYRYDLDDTQRVGEDVLLIFYPVR